jgi:hypothetical protein
MPRMVVFRKYLTEDALQLGVSHPEESNIPILYPSKNRAEVNVSLHSLAGLVANAKKMESLIGYNVDMGDVDAENIKVVSGFDLGNGSSSNTTSAYYISCSPGVVKCGSHFIRYAGTSNGNPLALCYDLDGAACSTRLLADGNSQKIRWYAVRTHIGASGETGYLFGIMGDEDLTATVGAVTVDDGFPTDAQVEAAFSGRQATLDGLGGGFVMVVWVEVARTLISRSGASVTYSHVDLKDSDPVQFAGVQFVDKEVDHSAIATAGLTNTVDFNPINGIFVGATLQTLEASDLAALTIELGASGSTDDMFDPFDVGTSGSATLGLKATVPRAVTPFVCGQVLNAYKPQLLFTGGANLDTATTGTWRVRLYYIPVADNTATGVLASKFDENVL